MGPRRGDRGRPRAGPPGRPGRRRGRRDDVHRRARRRRHGLRCGVPARAGPARAAVSVDGPRGHGPDRGPTAAAGARRRSHRGRDGPGGQAVGCLGHGRPAQRPPAAAGAGGPRRGGRGGSEVRGDPPARRDGPAAPSRGHRARDGRDHARSARDRRRRPPPRRPGPVGHRGRHRPVAVHRRRRVPGAGRGVEHPRATARGRLRGGAAGSLLRPAGRRGRGDQRGVRRHRPARRGPPDGHLHAGLRHPPGLPDPAVGRQPPHRRLRPGTGGRRVAPTGDRGRPRPSSPSVLLDVIPPLPTFAEAFLHA